MNREAFGNLIIGPVVSIPEFGLKQSTIQEIIDKNLIITSYITDVNHPVFKEFSDLTQKEKPVAVFITVQYKYLYE